jgi:hypothetical protein
MDEIMDRERLAMIIHKGTTQTPGTMPHECDYETADLVLYEFELLLRSKEEKNVAKAADLPLGPSKIWDTFNPSEPRLTGFGLFQTGKDAQDFIDRLETDISGLGWGYVVRAL